MQSDSRDLSRNGGGSVNLKDAFERSDSISLIPGFQTATFTP